MSSKDKLIEFLKSSEIHYYEYTSNVRYEVELEYTIFIFDLQGNYLD